MRHHAGAVGNQRHPVYRAGMDNTNPPPRSDAALPDWGPGFWFRLFNEIGIINQLSTTQLEAALPKGLKAADFRVLNHFIRLGGPRTPLQLARSFQITKGTMTHTVQKMSGLGLVSVAPHADDARSKLVDITQKGRDVHAQTMVNLVPNMEAVMGTVDAAGQETLRAAFPALVHLRQVLDKARD